jgi:dihydroorotase
MNHFIIRNATVVNRGEKFEADVEVEGDYISRVEKSGISNAEVKSIDATGQWLLPGVIDDQVHFREPGLTHKAEIATESRAALAGGVTSYMEMPNVNPQTVTVELLEEKMAIAAERSAVNYSFFMGTTNHNLDELRRVDPLTTCGVKIFMGSSTGDMLVDDEKMLETIFGEIPLLIATHCECESRVKSRIAEWIGRYGDAISPEQHAIIRDDQACYLSSSFARDLALKYSSRLHILHITSALETHLFRNDIPLKQKRITSEVCVHHLHFTANDYPRLGNLIKCNPSIKGPENREELWKALLDDRIDIIATDHAPHTWDEKQNPYPKSPAGLPLVQHSLQMMLEYVKEGRISMQEMVRKMCHAPADCFQVHKRGYLDEGFYADLVLVKPNSPYRVEKGNILYKCGWSPLEGSTFSNSIDKVWVNGTLSWDNGITGQFRPMRLTFDRN